MKAIIAGGTGQVGTILARALVRDNHEVVTLTRRQPASGSLHGVRAVTWSPDTPTGPWLREFDDADVVINLAGRSVNCRYNNRNRQEIMNSRIDSTRAVGAAIAQATPRDRVWLQASTATIYSHRYDAANDEFTGVIGGNEPNVPSTWKFSIDVATAWERAACSFHLPATRLVLLRSAMVMSPDCGGIFDTLLRLVRRGLGGTSGDGRQFVSWIHERDFVRAVQWLIQRSDFSGPVNLAAPNPLPNRDFMRALRQAAGGFGSRIALPAARWMLELGAIIMRTETELILKSRRVVPARLLRSGFTFDFPAWPAAARELCDRWRVAHCA